MCLLYEPFSAKPLSLQTVSEVFVIRRTEEDLWKLLRTDNKRDSNGSFLIATSLIKVLIPFNYSWFTDMLTKYHLITDGLQIC